MTIEHSQKVEHRPHQQGGRRAAEVLTCGLTLPTSLARLPSLGKKSTLQGAERDTFSLMSRCKARQAAPEGPDAAGAPAIGAQSGLPTPNSWRCSSLRNRLP